MILTYSHTPVPERIRQNPFDLRKKCKGAIHSYRGEDGHEYRREFLVPADQELPAPPNTLNNKEALHKQVPGILYR